MASNNSIVFQNFFLFYISCVAAACLLHPLTAVSSTVDDYLWFFFAIILYSLLCFIRSPSRKTTTTAHIKGRTNGFATDDGNFLFHSSIKFWVELSIQCWGCCSLIWELFECAQSTQTALFAHISTNSRQLLHISVWSLYMQCALSVVRRFNIIILYSFFMLMSLSLCLCPRSRFPYKWLRAYPQTVELIVRSFT